MTNQYWTIRGPPPRCLFSATIDCRRTGRKRYLLEARIHTRSAGPHEQSDQIGNSLDPVSLEIIRTGLQSIPDLIEADLMRTAFSPLIYEYKDYAVGLVDGSGRSIALASHGLPGFLTNVLGAAVRDGIALYGIDNIEPGDVIISNHAATMGQHLNNVIMYTPIFGAGPRPLAFMAVNVHWIDIGGRYPGSCLGTDTTELIQEGLQLRTVKLYKRGERCEDIFRVIEYNTRQPEMLLGDIEAQYAGCVKGKQLFENLIIRHGEELLFDAIHQIWAKSADAAHAAVRKVPEGAYRARASWTMMASTSGRPIPIRIKVIIKDGEFTVDYSGIANQVKGPYNSGRWAAATPARGSPSNICSRRMSRSTKVALRP